MSNAVLDLDVLRPAKRIVKLGGHEIDVSFVPVALTFDLDEIEQERVKLDLTKIQNGDRKEIKKAFDLSVKLCVAFCQWKHPEMDEQWFRQNVDVQQMSQLGEEIRQALTRAYKGIDPKKTEAAQES